MASTDTKVTITPTAPNPLAYVGVRLHMRGVLHGKGYGIISTNKMIAGLDDATIDTVSQNVPSATDNAYGLLARIGTGQITGQSQKLQATGGFLATLLGDLTAFFQTPEGAALETALVQALVALIAGA